MNRIIVPSILVFLCTSILFASESRLIGLNYFNSYPEVGTLFLVEDPFNITYVSGYVNYDTNFIILEPRQGALGIFNNSYGLLKYALVTPIERLNFSVIFNYSYPELSLITNIAISDPFDLLDHLRNRIDVIVGISGILGIKMLKPYIGFGYASDFTNVNISYYQGDTITNKISQNRSIQQIKLILGSVVDLSFISVDAGVKLYLPYAEVSFKTNNPTINNYQNFRENKTEGAFGFDISLQPKLKFSANSYLMGFARYFSYALPAKETVIVDIDGNGTPESQTNISKGLQNVVINAGASYNLYINNLFISFGASFGIRNLYLKLNDQTELNGSTFVPVFVSFEVPFVDWFVIRSGVSKSIYRVTYYGSDSKQTSGVISDLSLATPLSSLSLGFSIKPLKDLSLDWVVSYNFLDGVLVNGTLPWILSGDSGFNNITSLWSIEYRIP
ncbi:MAG: hypothetical protein N2712_01065 [Brevinematales bacterium]|nr:hypothetical protein [Brevinematales bacterium]